MPIIKQAIKKLRHDKKVAAHNAAARLKLRTILKDTRKKPTPKTISQTFSALDKAVKTHLIHLNKAARLKSRLAKLLSK